MRKIKKKKSNKRTNEIFFFLQIDIFPLRIYRIECDEFEYSIYVRSKCCTNRLFHVFFFSFFFYVLFLLSVEDAHNARDLNMHNVCKKSWLMINVRYFSRQKKEKIQHFLFAFCFWFFDWNNLCALAAVGCDYYKFSNQFFISM